MPATDFQLDPRLAGDTHFVADWPLCRLLLMNEARYPWFILVPRRPDLREAFELPPADYLQLWNESRELAQWMQRHFAADKLNLAALGNMVPQLHLHHIARQHDDAAWPGPVWGRYPPQPYATQQRDSLLAAARQIRFANSPQGGERN